MKILHIIPNLRKGGAERLVLDICGELSKQEDIDLRLITFSPDNDYTFLSQNINHLVIPSRVIPSITGKPLININELINFISEFKPHIIHSHLFEAEMISRQVLFQGVKYITHCHDNMPQFRRFGFTDLFSKKRLTELYERKQLFQKYKECNNHFIGISKDTYGFLENSLPSGLKANIHLLPNAIDCSRFQVEHRESDVMTFVNAGSFVPKKNHKFFIPLAKELIKYGLKFKIILLGDGPLRNDFITEMNKERLEAYFELPGNVDNIAKYYAKSRIYIHAATYEPFGLVLLEAMAAGLPVVCLNGKGNMDIIEQGKNGFIIYEINAEKFAEKIIRLIEDQQLYSKMSNYAQEYVQKYDIKNYVIKLMEIYAEL